MSKSTQLNFFIVPEDLPEINDFLKAKGVLFIKTPVIEGASVFSEGIGMTDKDENPRVYLVGKKYEKRLKLWEERQGASIRVDLVRSYAIEFERGNFTGETGSILLRSKFHSIFVFDDGGRILKKEAEFKVWVEGVYSGFKKTFLQRMPEFNNLYFSTRALDWAKQHKARLDKEGNRAFGQLKETTEKI